MALKEAKKKEEWEKVTEDFWLFLFDGPLKRKIKFSWFGIVCYEGQILSWYVIYFKFNLEQTNYLCAWEGETMVASI